jgi:sterol 24-C-methyltransferase
VHESFAASIARHEHLIAKELRLRAGMKVVDVGCGVGGPMREIARFSGASIVGINNNAYQIERGDQLNVRYRLAHLCAFHKADFMDTALPDASFDAAYAIEATCHAPDRTRCYAEILRLLKPGGEFFAYEWCMTDRFDPRDARHLAIKHGIEAGDGLPDLATILDVDRAVTEAGFELLAARDLVADSDPETPWWLPLQGEGVSIASFRSSRFGRWVTHRTVGMLESLRIAPKGTQFVHGFLNDAAEALIEGGQTGIFTPMYMVHGRRPH